MSVSGYRPVPNSDQNPPMLAGQAPKKEYSEALASHEKRISFYNAGIVASGITFLALMILSAACLSLSLWTGGVAAIFIGGLGFYLVSEADCCLTEMYLARKAAKEYFGTPKPSLDCFQYLRNDRSAMRHLLSFGNVDFDKICEDETTLRAGQCTPCVQALFQELAQERIPNLRATRFPTPMAPGPLPVRSAREGCPYKREGD